MGSLTCTTVPGDSRPGLNSLSITKTFVYLKSTVENMTPESATDRRGT